jgi:hypothetical protein
MYSNGTDPYIDLLMDKSLVLINVFDIYKLTVMRFLAIPCVRGTAVPRYLHAGTVHATYLGTPGTSTTAVGEHIR